MIGMIFRKPYGFLIKNFKLIHLILTGLFIYLLIKVRDILGFYNAFILGNASKLNAMSYVSNFYLWSIVIAIVICIIIYGLLEYKKKPRALYLGLIAFLIVTGFIIDLSFDGLKEIAISVLDLKTLRLYRDLLRILVIFQYASVAVVLVRGLGFDIKKFDFVKDMHELNLDVSDDEEVELTLGNTNTLQRKFFRWWRELKYYYLENKLFILIFLIILVAIGGSTLFVRNEFVNKVYQEGERFSSSEFSFNVLESYVTNRSSDGQVILKDDSSFVILKMAVAPYSRDKKLNSGNFVLHVNQNTYTYDNYYGSRFSDLGTAYKGQAIRGEKVYLFIFKVANTDINSDMAFIYSGELTVQLSSIMLDEAEKSVNYKVGDNINLSDTSLGSGNFMINSYEVAKSFPYSYQYEVGGQTFTSQYSISSVKGSILNLKITSNYSGLNNYSFLNTYAVLNYKIGEEVKTVKFDDKTPGNYKEGVYLGADSELLEAEEIWFDIIIRNKHYVYRLK